MICSNCNSTQDNNAIVCANCGASLPETSVVIDSPKKGKSKLLFLIPILIIGIVGGMAVSYFTRPTLGPVLLNTKNQFDQEIQTAKANNPMSAEIKALFAGNYSIDFDISKYLSTSEFSEHNLSNMSIIYDDTDQVATVNFETDTPKYKDININVMKGTSTAYREYPTKSGEIFTTLKNDLVSLVSDKVDVRGKKSKDENFDAEFTFEMNYGEFINAFTKFFNSQNELNNQVLMSYDLEFQPLKMEEIHKLAAGAFGSDYNFYAKMYMESVVEEYNANLPNLNAELKTSVDQAIMESNQEFESIIDILTEDFDTNEIVNVTIKSKDDLVKSIVLSSKTESDNLILDISNPTSYLNSDYRMYIENTDEGEINLKIISTADNWAYDLTVNDSPTVSGYSMALDWKFKDTTDNFKFKIFINDGPADENIDASLSLSGDAQNGYSVSDGNYVNAIIKSK